MNAVMDRSKFTSLYEPDMTRAQRISDAINGSRMLKEAILTAKGYKVPVAVVPPPPVEEPKLTAPKFRERKARRGPPRKRGRKPSRHSAKVERIKALVAEHFSLSLEELENGNRRYARPRQIAMYLARKATPTSYPRLGRQFGGFDHTTVIHAERQVEKRIADNDLGTIKAVLAVYSVIGA